jgi:RNA polymerase sigma-70 factor (ECF subfamily)
VLKNQGILFLRIAQNLFVPLCYELIANRMKKQTSHLSDEDLQFLYLETKDNSYIGELFRRYAYLLKGVCLHYTSDINLAEDAVIAVFETLLKNMQPIRVIENWLLTCVKNEIIRIVQKADNQPFIEFDEKKFEKNSDFYVENDWFSTLIDSDDEKTTEMLLFFIQLLPDLQQQSLYLFYWDKQSYKQIAAQLETTPQAVKSHIQTAKLMLRKHFLAEK